MARRTKRDPGDEQAERRADGEREQEAEAAALRLVSIACGSVPSAICVAQHEPDVGGRRQRVGRLDARAVGQLPDEQEQRRATTSGGHSVRERLRRAADALGGRAAVEGVEPGLERARGRRGRCWRGHQAAPWRRISVRRSSVIVDRQARDLGRLDPARVAAMPTSYSCATRPGRDDSSTTRSPSRTASRTLCVTNSDRQVLRLPDPDELLVQHVAGDGVERGERLVHEQDAGCPGRARGPWRRAGACRRTARGRACRRRPRSRTSPSRSAGPLAALLLADALEPQRELDVLRSR